MPDTASENVRMNDEQATTTVYVVVPGGYDEYAFASVHATLEGAQAAAGGGEWTEPDEGYWENGEPENSSGVRYEIYRSEVLP